MRRYLHIFRNIAVASASIFAMQAVFFVSHAHAATITVNSQADAQADDGDCTLREAIISANADAVSGASGGECSAGSGADTIEFNLSDTSSYALGASPGYEISLTAALPHIVEPVDINGYSQPLSSVNTAASPAPPNAKILVEISGSSMGGFGGNYHCFSVLGATDVTFRGMLITDCGGDGIRMDGATNVTIQGNYIGLGYDDTLDVALISKPNGGTGTGMAYGNGVYIENSSFTQIGGINPEDRNIISGNQFSEVLINSYYLGNSQSDPADSDHTSFQGNYFGLAGDGLTAMPCGYDFGHGNALLITHSSDDLIGGTDPGARNVIASSKEYGISFRNGSHNSVVENNYIGTDYTGNGVVSHSLGTGHPEAAVSVAQVSNGGYNLGSWNIRVGGPLDTQRNIIGGNSHTSGVPRGIGVFIHDGVSNNTVQNNYIGVGADGTTPIPNQTAGVEVDRSDATLIRDNRIANNATGIDSNYLTTDITILSNRISDNSQFGIRLFNTNNFVIGRPGDGNIVFASGLANILATGISLSGYPMSDGKIQANSIGVDNWETPANPSILGGAGILIGYGDPTRLLVGGVNSGEGNVIVGSQAMGVGISGLTVEAFSASVATTDVSILGNSIYGTDLTSTPLSLTSGEGIDLYMGIDETIPPDGQPDVFVDLGQNPNDPAGSVPAMANDFLNRPEIAAVSQEGSTVTAVFDANVTGAGADEYRIEFFSNGDASTAQLQTYLGAVTVPTGLAQAAAFTIPSGMDLTGRYVTATVTQLNGTTGDNNGGFGATSEISDPILATVTAPSSLAETGQALRVLIILACTGLVGSAIYISYQRRKLKS